MRWDREERWYWPESKPREAKGGIKAQTRRGSFGKTWWAKRWIGILEEFDIGARLGRGRRYARGGQVLDIDIDRGLVTAKVQGTREKPYKIAIHVKELSPEDWEALAACVAGKALFAAKLLAGEMPQQIEEAFLEAGLSLFPESEDDLTTHCTCPDWSNPCKHIAAVYYLIGEEFDRDPFLMFRLRGMERDELLRMVSGGESADARRPDLDEPEEAALPPEPLAVDPAEFWHIGKLPDNLFGEVQAPSTCAALAKRLGSFPFWRGQEPFLESLEQVCTAATSTGMDAFLVEQPDEVT